MVSKNPALLLQLAISSSVATIRLIRATAGAWSVSGRVRGVTRLTGKRGGASRLVGRDDGGVVVGHFDGLLKHPSMSLLGGI